MNLINRYTIILFSFSFILLSNLPSKKKNKYDFDESKYKFDTPDSLVKSFIIALIECDSNEILSHSLSKETTFYFIEQTIKSRPKEQTLEKVINTIDANFNKSQQEFVAKSKMLKSKIDNDSLDLSKVVIVSIDYKVESLPESPSKLKCASVQAKLKFKNKEYLLKIPLLGSLKSKWFIFGPEFHWNGKMVTH